MKTILMTAYAVNPYKGSEDGMGWNFVMQAAIHNNIIAITRKNNRPHIERYQTENPNSVYSNIKFEYFDWPLWTLFWKKGPILSLIYYYFWQLTLAIHIRRKKWHFDLAHNLNFHNDWTPSFLWMTGKPFIWGPVGHHPKIEWKHIKFYGIKAVVMDRFLWTLKLIFWNLDPMLWLTKKKAQHILCMNEDAAKKLRLRPDQYSICPSVATEDPEMVKEKNENFTVISVGRFVPLKGFDITIRAFAEFYNNLQSNEKLYARLHLVGSGPYENPLKQLANSLLPDNVVQWTNWIDRTELQKLYSQSSVFLFPSYEGAGMVVAEAMAQSLPVICWDNSGPGKFVHPQSELTVPMGTTVAMAIKNFANKLHITFQNRLFYQNESILARSRFNDYFQWSTRGIILKQVFNVSSESQHKIISKEPLLHAVHLLNDYSGSPLVFRDALKKEITTGAHVLIHTATPNGKGFLSQMEGSLEMPIKYRWSKNKLLTLLYFILSQLSLLIRLTIRVKSKDTVYVNTLLPFGALIAGKLKGAHVKLHIHEVSLKPQLLKRWLVWVAERTADEIIFVSDYVRSCYTFKKPKTTIVLNTLSDDFIRVADKYKSNPTQARKTVLMLCSLKAYKGIYEFIDIATRLPNISFELVLNAKQEEIDQWKKTLAIPKNCTLFPSQSNTHPFYQRAAVVMNLSRTDEWIETFGMTILEAQAYECYIIAPPVGGPVELMSRYPHGTLINSRKVKTISNLIQSTVDMAMSA